MNLPYEEKTSEKKIFGKARDLTKKGYPQVAGPLNEIDEPEVELDLVRLRLKINNFNKVPNSVNVFRFCIKILKILNQKGTK